MFGLNHGAKTCPAFLCFVVSFFLKCMFVFFKELYPLVFSELLCKYFF